MTEDSPPRHQPRFWRVRRPGLVQGPDALDPEDGLAFADQEDVWWAWEPATERFHGDTPWLWTDFNSRAQARSGVLLNPDDMGPIRFDELSLDQARQLIESGTLQGAAADAVTRRRNDQDSLRFDEAAAQLATYPST